MLIFLFTDIEGSTEKWRQHGDAMGQALARHDAILQGLIGKYGGKIVKHTGDGVFAVFVGDEDINPLQCTVEIEKRLSGEDWGDVGEIRVRIALHAGEAEKRGDDYFGPAVNRAARLLTAGWGGQVLLTREAKDNCQPPEKAELKSLGFHVLKDLGEPQEIYGLTHPDLPLKKFPPLRSLNARPNNLPLQATAFIGRQPELEDIAGLLEQSSCRLLTLLGPGGVGKTRIALQAAAERIEDYPHGVYFVALAPLNSTDSIISTIASSLGFSFYSTQDPKLQLLNYLRRKKTLLTMDNFEHLIDGAGLIAEILEAAPEVKILATSRQRLNLQSEWIYEVKGMRFPGADGTEDLETFSALELFAASARRIRPDFVLTDELESRVIQICRLVGGLPLAIELAASWLRALSLEEIAEEIKEDFGFLETSAKDMPERHRSLRRVFSYSWKLLSAEEQKSLAKLAIFRGGFSRDAARKVAGASISILSSLVDKSLVSRTPGGRYDMHETVRQYAEDKLKKMPKEDERTHELHVSYYAELLSLKEVDLYGKRMKETLEEVETEIQNLRAAWEWALEHACETEIGNLLEAIYQLYTTRGWFKDAAILFSRTLTRLADAAGKPAQKGSLITGRLLLYLGWLCINCGDYEQGGKHLAASLDIFRRLKDKACEAYALNRLGSLTLFGGDFEGARKLQEQSLACAREKGSRRTEATALMSLGNIARKSGEYAVARKHYEKSLAIYTEIEHLVGRALSLGNLGIVACRTGELEEARRLDEESMAIVKELDNRRMIAEGLSDLGSVARNMGNYDQARKYYAESLALNRELGIRSATAITLESMATLAVMTGNYSQAKELLIEALAISRNLGRKVMIAGQLTNLGKIALQCEEYEEAKRRFHEALTIAKTVRVVPSTIDLLARVAELYLKEGKPKRALELAGFILEHPASVNAIKEDALQLIEVIDPKPSSLEIAAARKKGTTKKFEEVVEEILGEEHAGKPG